MKPKLPDGQSLEDHVLARMLAMPPDPKKAVAKPKKKAAKKPPKK